MEGFDVYGAGVFATVGVGSGWTSNGGNIVSGDSRNGTFCLSTGGGTNHNSTFGLVNQPRRGLGFAAKCTSLPPGSTRGIGGFTTTSGNYINIGIPSGGSNYALYNGTTLVASLSKIAVAGVYDYIEMDYNAATGAITIRINETEEVLTTSTIVGGDINGLRFGRNSGSVGLPGLFIDDVYVTDNGDLLGDRAVITTFPDADLLNQDWVPNPGPDGFDMLNNVPPTADYVEAVNLGDVSDFDFPALPVTAFQVEAVMISPRWVRTAASVEEATAHVIIAGTPYSLTPVIVPQTTPIWDRFVWGENPATLTQWLPAEIQTGFEAGIERTT